MRFSKLIKGFDQLRVVDLQLPGPGAISVRVGVKPLPAWDETYVRESAAKFAKERGGSASNDDHIYVMGIWVHTLLLACVSTDAEDKGLPFFESAEEILRGLDRDRIAYLYEQQQYVQEDAGARKDRMTQDEMVQTIMKLAKAEGVDDVHLFFSGLGPTVRATLVRFMANLLWLSQPGSLLGGQDSSSISAPAPAGNA